MAWLVERIEESAKQWPEGIAIQCGEESITRRQLVERMLEVAGALTHQGVAPGDKVGLLATRSIPHVIAMLGILRAGAAYMPLDPANPRARLEKILERAGAKLVVSSQSLNETFLPDTLPVAQLFGEEWKKNCPPLDALGLDNSTLVYVIHTSGSTGTPKGAGVYHSGFRNLLEWYVEATSLGVSDAVLVISSPTFDLTQKNLFAPLLSGGRLVLDPSPHYEIGRLRRMVAKHHVTLLNCTPSAFYPLIDQVGENEFQELASLRHVVLGGEPITTERLRPWLLSGQCHADILNTYGPTECTDIALHYRLNRANHQLHESVPAGLPLPQVHVAVVDESLRKVLPGQPGELVIGGAGVGAGYLGDPVKTSESFPANPFPEWKGDRIYRTGDRARQLPNGMIEFLGRIDHQIKIRGYRVELGEIETALCSHQSVRDAVVVPVGSVSTDSLAAFVTLEQGQPDVNSATLRQHMSRLLPDYMVPGAVFILESLPWTRHGKIDRRALAARAVAGDNTSSLSSTVAPATPLERMILSLWQEVIGRRDFGVNDAFLEVGGTSLHIATIHAQLQNKLGQSFSITRLLGHPTVRDLAASFECNAPATQKPSTALRSSIDAAERARLARERLAARSRGKSPFSSR